PRAGGGSELQLATISGTATGCRGVALGSSGSGAEQPTTNSQPPRIAVRMALSCRRGAESSARGANPRKPSETPAYAQLARADHGLDAGALGLGVVTARAGRQQEHGAETDARAAHDEAHRGDVRLLLAVVVELAIGFAASVAATAIV